MAAVNPYLMFNGNCEEAFLFYKSVFGGEFPYIGRYKDAPAEEDEKLSEEQQNRIMHVSLPIGNTILMASDSHPRYGDVGFGDNFSISINAESTDEADRILVDPAYKLERLTEAHENYMLCTSLMLRLTDNSHNTDYISQPHTVKTCMKPGLILKNQLRSLIEFSTR